jgi:hypothetical protein
LVETKQPKGHGAKISTALLEPTAQRISNTQRLLKALNLQPNRIPTTSSSPTTHSAPQHQPQKENHKPLSPAKMASP